VVQRRERQLTVRFVSEPPDSILLLEEDTTRLTPEGLATCLCHTARRKSLPGRPVERRISLLRPCSKSRPARCRPTSSASIGSSALRRGRRRRRAPWRRYGRHPSP